LVFVVKLTLKSGLTFLTARQGGDEVVAPPLRLSIQLLPRVPNKPNLPNLSSGLVWFGSGISRFGRFGRFGIYLIGLPSTMTKGKGTLE
jgi:hypothetical protein